MTTIPRVPVHTHKSVRETVLIPLEEVKSAGIKLCNGRLEPRERPSGDRSINVVYIVATLNKGKLANMDEDMRKKLHTIRFGKSAASINFLGTYGLPVSSGQPAQPKGFFQGVSGAAGKTGRIGNAFTAVQNFQLQTTPRMAIGNELASAITNADVHIFGGQEACPDMETEPAYEPNYIAYFYATQSPVEQSKRYCIAKTPGLMVVKEAVDEAIKRNEHRHRERDDWTGGKVLQELGIVESDSNWHPELGPANQDRFFYSDQGYKKLDLPQAWFEIVTAEHAPTSSLDGHSSEEV
ncbi:hypothetical protein PENANT_c069G07357 [Penicillium antarcticum]|uniref:Uncharacterized protein n=1 Tax=Penicillium antarcticum TaxID=416450 RepID=A0A1V6PQZ8_9EURO|nr:uncharacterized protein N7508_011110 [Penicillium antarcticum]KAJ5288335.1 hypothetical protein N7508_011110 [Penicillium antarcticum]OQD78966.1 hypothetical protein PENANT_c069G07357 [Penicillium antarcticum]